MHRVPDTDPAAAADDQDGVGMVMLLERRKPARRDLEVPQVKRRGFACRPHQYESLDAPPGRPAI